ncbi:MAG: hypothetical protein KGJ29_13475, partial [Hyphomicrobiales bacterium]|nr:hypothetical protein [Hyphomicrobiales bacterium]
MNPSIDDVVAYGFKDEIETTERPLWLGTPNLKYAYILAMPLMMVLLETLVAVVAIYDHITYDGSPLAQREVMIFDTILFSLFIFNMFYILILTQFTYLITEKNLYIFIKDNWFANLSFSVRRACRICKSRFLKFDLSLFGTLSVYN